MTILYKRPPKHPRWMPLYVIAFAAGLLLLVLVLLLSGCKTTTLFVPDASPVRLREPISSAKVWVQNENGAWIEGRVDLQAGWYVLSDPEQTSTRESRP